MRAAAARARARRRRRAGDGVGPRAARGDAQERTAARPLRRGGCALGRCMAGGRARDRGAAAAGGACSRGRARRASAAGRAGGGVRLVSERRDEFLSEEDLDLRNLDDAELQAYWLLWLRQAQATNDRDAPFYEHGVFRRDPAV